MEREPGEHGREAGPEADGSPPPRDRPRPRPRVDFSPALHEAGHEVADLGWEDVPDTGPVLHTDEGRAGPEDPLDFVNLQLPSD